jgi:hypothetical protein
MKNSQVSLEIHQYSILRMFIFFQDTSLSWIPMWWDEQSEAIYSPSAERNKSFTRMAR